MSLLKNYYDPKAEFPGDWVREAIVIEQVDRLIKLAYIAQVAADKKRRVGRDASYSEMAQDKKRCKRIAHAARTMERAWFTEIEDKYPEGYVLPMSEEGKMELHRIAGTINWDDKLSDWTSSLLGSIAKVASWAVKEGDTKFGNRCVSRLLTEIERMDMAVTR